MRKRDHLANRRVSYRWPPRLLALFAILMTAGVGFILSSDLLLTQRLSVEQGQAAEKDIKAPRRIEFVSDILTEAERRRALAAVTRVYDPLNRQIGREQVSLALQVLNFIDSVRTDPYATPDYQRFCLQHIESVDLSPQVITDTLALAEDQWKAVQTETRDVLARVMQEEIKSEQEDTARRSVRALIDLELNESQTEIVDEIASSLVKANRVYNPEATEAARAAALESVQPQQRVLEENQIIVRSGEIVTDLDIEALQSLGLLTHETDWVAVSGSFLLAVVPATAMCVFLWHRERELLRHPLHLLLLLLLILTFSLLAKWGLTLLPWQQYLVPLATLGMLVTVLFGAPIGLVTHIVVSLVALYLAHGEMDLFVYYLGGGLVGLFALRQVTRINAFTWAGMHVMVANVAIALAFVLLSGQPDTLAIGRLVIVGVVNGALSAVLTLGGYYLLGMIFDITTTLQLLDLARPTHPAMRELLLKAPGTYHHSIMVGNMAEQAAEAIGANALLARVGAFYHDIGKTVRPYFFTENQMEGNNPHDLLDPETSAQIIRRHTQDGLELARSRYHLPVAIQSFITEHHGTKEIAYFYHKAVEEYGEKAVDKAEYQHIGPTPQSKETAIVMLADSCEATVRSIRPPDAESLESLIRKIVAKTIASGQLDNAPLTLREIHVITSSFVDTLQGVFHPRIRYPDTAELSLIGEPDTEPAELGAAQRQIAGARTGQLQRAAAAAGGSSAQQQPLQLGEAPGEHATRESGEEDGDSG
jgi:putative nucleotidyltransferase with HDIG domain